MISGGVFINEDGEQVKLSCVSVVSVVHDGRYDLIVGGSYHLTVQESYYTRATFLAAWSAV